MINVLAAIKTVDFSAIAADRATQSIWLTKHVYSKSGTSHSEHLTTPTLCRTKTQGATQTKLYSLYIDEVETFKTELPANPTTPVFNLIGAWNMDGSQYGLQWVRDENGIITGTELDPLVTDNPRAGVNGAYWEFQLDVYLDDYAPSVLIGETTFTARQHYTNTSIVVFPNVKAWVQRERDYVVR